MCLLQVLDFFVVRAFFKSFSLFFKEVVCTFFKSFFANAPLNFTAKKGCVPSSTRFLLYLTPRKLCVPSSTRLFWSSRRGSYVYIRTCFAFVIFLRVFSGCLQTFTTFCQIVASGRQCLKVSNFPAFHSIQGFVRNAGVLDDFNRKGITPIFLDSVMDGRQLRFLPLKCILHGLANCYLYRHTGFHSET